MPKRKEEEKDSLNGRITVANEVYQLDYSWKGEYLTKRKQ